MRVVSTTFVFACASVALAAPAHAGRKETRRFFRLTEQAQERFDAEDYEGALGLFEEALEIKSDPVVEFNVAVCLDRLERFEEAAERYAVVESNRKAERRVRAYAKKRGQEIEEARAAAAAQAQKERRERRERERREREARERATAPRPVPPGPPVVAWAVTGTGALAMVTGGVLWGLSAAEQDALEGAPRFELRRAHQERARQYALGGDVSMIAGLVLAGLGVGLWLAHPSVTVAPEVGPESARLRISVPF